MSMDAMAPKTIQNTSSSEQTKMKKDTPSKIRTLFQSGFDLPYSTVRTVAFCYMALPFFIFSMTWLSFWMAAWSATVTCFILALVIFPKLLNPKAAPKNTNLNPTATDRIQIPYAVGMAVLLIAGIWVMWSGIGGGFYQSGDFPFRNAVFRDLLTYKWPVIYGNERGMLSYYIGFWLPAAAFGKFVDLFTDNSTIIWSLSNAALYLWTVIGVLLVLFMLYFNVNAINGKKIMAATVIFIFFSGMDAVGWLIGGSDTFFQDMINGPHLIHIEWWAKRIFFHSGKLLQYSSFTTQLFWVFNQSVMTWLCTLTLFREQTPQNFVFIGMMSLFCGPIPFFGFFVIALTRGIIFFWRARRHPKYTVKTFCSLSNLLSLVGIFPVCYSYFTCNSAANIKGDSKLLRFVPRLIFNVDGMADTGVEKKRVVLFVAFLALEFLLVALLIWWHNRKDLTFWVCIAMLCVCPLIFTGAAADFCMRATIPALVLFCMYAIRFLFDNFEGARFCIKRLLCYGVILFLLLGAATPIVEMSRGVYVCKEAGHLVTYNYGSYNDRFKSLSEKNPGDIKNFTAQNYKDSKFYKYFAKR